MDDNSPLDYAAFIQELDELDRILADPDVRLVFYAELDEESTPMVDNNPVDFAAMMQDIDELDQILAGIEYADHTDNHDNVMDHSDVRHTADTHLDGVSKPTDDNSPVDVAAMMQDIDDLDQILAGIEYANNIDTRDNVHCRVCSGQPCGSSGRCTCRTCINGGVPSSGSICTRCHSLPSCVVCHRHLPPAYFPPNSPPLPGLLQQTGKATGSCKRT